jgi:hypothetical protein
LLPVVEPQRRMLRLPRCTSVRKAEFDCTRSWLLSMPRVSFVPWLPT